MKDLSDKSRVTKRPNAASQKKHGFLHRCRWKFKYFMYNFGFESFMPPRPNFHHFAYGKYKVPEEELEKCPKGMSKRIFKRKLQEKAFEEALEKWKNGEPYETEEFNVVDDIKFIYRDYKFAKEMNNTGDVISYYLILALGIFLVCATVYGVVVIVRFILSLVPNAPECLKLFNPYK